MELWDVYDSQGNPTGRVKERHDSPEEGEYRLVCSLWILNAEGKALMQKRSMLKKVDPGKWNITGGSSNAGETSMEACLREVEEEIGLRLQPEDISLLTRKFIEGTIFDDYITVREFDIAKAVLQPDEVIELRWMTLDELRGLYDEGKFMFSDMTELDKVEEYMGRGRDG